MSSFSERLHPSWWMVLALGFVFPATLLILLPVNVVWGFALGMIFWVSSVLLLWVSSPVIAVSDGVLQVGKASLEVKFISEVEVFRHDAARHIKGPGSDVRSWLCLRPWVDPVVKVTLNDPDDPTPYWLISTRRPDQLRQALGF
jgi:hypothetical protein